MFWHPAHEPRRHRAHVMSAMSIARCNDTPPGAFMQTVGPSYVPEKLLHASCTSSGIVDSYYLSNQINSKPCEDNGV